MFSYDAKGFFLRKTILGNCNGERAGRSGIPISSWLQRPDASVLLLQYGLPPTTLPFYLDCSLYASEFGVFAQPCQLHRSRRPIPLLCNYYLAYVFLFRILMVVFIPVEEHDNICILFYCPGISKV